MYTHVHDFWISLEVPFNMVMPLTVASMCLSALLISAIVYLLCRKIVSPLVLRLVRSTPAAWDDIIFSHHVLNTIGFVVFAILLHSLLPPAAKAYPWLYTLSVKITLILLVAAVVRLLNRLFKVAYELLARNRRVKMQPIRGLVQMLQLIAIIIGVIISVSIIINRDPALILTSLGASAAILMLVFKDTILGVVAGVQLSANDMLRKDDWIVVPGTDVNGTVLDVTLTTVKVQNFDNTIVTVPPYNLISGSFQNWRGMTESGGRRIMRSVLIDLRTVRFLTPAEVDTFGKAPWLPAASDGIDAPLVNLTMLRAYLEDFLLRYSKTKTDFIYMVRQLEPTPNGVPIQVYCFTTQTDWKLYEHTQAEIFDHIYAVVGAFGLRIYQAPGAEDILSLAKDGATLHASADGALLAPVTPSAADGQA